MPARRASRTRPGIRDTFPTLFEVRPANQESTMHKTSTSRRRPRRIAALAAALAVGASAMIASTTSLASDSRGCPYDRPCIDETWVTKARNVYVSWTATEDFDKYNVRWWRAGKAPVQVEVAGGRSGEFHVSNARSQTTYQFAIQGCNERFLAPSKCSPWEPAQKKTPSFAR
jgi:hypothetical protein